MSIKDDSGISLAELLVVIALMGVITVIAVPAIVGQMSHLRLTSSVRDISTELNAARLKAISNNTMYRVQFTLSSSVADTYRLYVYDASADSWSAETSRTTRSLEGGINISTPSADFNVDFRPNGSSTGASICVDNTGTSGDRMEVTAQTSTGMITITTGC